MTRTQKKKHINDILRETTKGLHCDDYWQPVHNAWRQLNLTGYEVTLISAEYGHDDKGKMCEKMWKFEIDLGTKKPLSGILTAHGAGTTEDPLCKYDISAYVS